MLLQADCSEIAVPSHPIRHKGLSVPNCSNWLFNAVQTAPHQTKEKFNIADQILYVFYLILKDSLKLDSMGEHFSQEEHPALGCCCVGQEKACQAKLLTVESWSLRSWDVSHTKIKFKETDVVIQTLLIRSPADQWPYPRGKLDRRDKRKGQSKDE